MKIICIGRNYAAHARELGNDIPEEPVIFMKPKSALQKVDNAFFYPEFCNELHYECEIVLRVSKNGAVIPKHKASGYYDAITVGYDFTARDIQDECKKKGLPWEKAKAFDQSAAVGTFIPIKEITSTKNINFSLLKNGEQVQKGNTSEMIFCFENLVMHISRYFTLNIGDLIFTGTPAGVGECLPGDVLEGFLEDKKLLSVELK